MKRFLALLLCLLLLYTGACAQVGDVYDPAATQGQLSIRYLGLDTTNGEKSGDSTVLISPDGKVMLLDAGEPTAAPMVVEALQKLGVKTIDFVVASHPHIDHVGGMPSVFEHFDVGMAMTSAVDYPTHTNQSFLGAIKSAGVPHTILKRGDSFMFGEFVRVDVLWPEGEITYPKGYPDGSTQFVNNLSLVLKFTYNDSSALFAGDLYVIGEKSVVKALGADALKADVLKINHHGADTSSSKTFRTAVQAKVAVAMCNTIQSLTVCPKFVREGTSVFHTFVDGTVLVQTSGDGTYTVVCEKQRKSDI